MTLVMQGIPFLSPGEVMSFVTPELTEKQQECLSGKKTDWRKRSEMKQSK